MMNNASAIDEEIAHLLKQMELAMPEVRRQIEVYEKGLKSRSIIRSPKATALLKHA